jgi:histidine triad (HIT) family protein
MVLKLFNMEKNCVFCKIIDKEIPAKEVYRDSDAVVFYDINPKAKTHLLVVPTTHIETFLDLQDKQFSLLTKLLKVVQQLVRGQKIEGAYRISINGGRHQEIPHLHFHLLGD